MAEDRYRLISDGDHEYAIPVNREADWNAWLDSDAALDGDDSAVRDWAIRIDGRFTFTDPRCA